MTNLDFDTNPITEQEVIAILGNGYKTQHNELIWRCPACPNGDKAGDNLKFNRQKQVLHCFACDFGQEICEIIARRRYEASRGGGEATPQTSYAFERKEDAPVQEVEKEKEIKPEDLNYYYQDCHYRLMKRKDLLKKLFEKHGVMPMTAAMTFIGYDDKKDMLVFPSKACDTDPTKSEVVPNGAEYREYEGKKTIRRISGYDSRICKVFTQFSPKDPYHAFICEGYKDAYNLLQIIKMQDPLRLNCTSIFTVQNGTNSINVNNCLQKINWNKFAHSVNLLLDNDEAGTKATLLAQELFPKMRDVREFYLGDCNDVAEKFEKQYGVHVDIDKALSAKWLDDYKEAV